MTEHETLIKARSLQEGLASAGEFTPPSLPPSLPSSGSPKKGCEEKCER